MAEARPYDIPKQVVWDAVGLDWKSRMRRELHVRFREGPGVKFPRATRRFVLDDRHFHRVVTEYVRYHNDARPHQGIGQRTPVHAEHPAEGNITTLPVLAGLHHEYRRAA